MQMYHFLFLKVTLREEEYNKHILVTLKTTFL